MRWDRLFDDLEALTAAERAREREGEIADRTRRERGQLDLQARMLANVGNEEVSFRLYAGSIMGRLVDVGPDWALVESRGHSVVVALPAVRALTGLARGARTPTVVARSFGLAAVMRGVSRDRSPVEIVDLESSALTGTVESVGGDHVELVLHPADVPRRREHLAGRVIVPMWSLGTMRRL